MKRTLYIFVFAVISVLSVSCDKTTEVQPKLVNSVSINLDSWKTSVKSGDDDDILLPDIPVLTGKATNSDGSTIVNACVELKSLPDYYLNDQTVTDSEGKFTFFDVAKGSYQIVVKQNGVISGSTKVNM